MEDRKLISEEEFDEAVFDIIDKDIERGAPLVLVDYETLGFAELCKKLFHKKPDTCDAEEALRKAVSKDDNTQH